MNSVPLDASRRNGVAIVDLESPVITGESELDFDLNDQAVNNNLDLFGGGTIFDANSYNAFPDSADQSHHSYQLLTPFENSFNEQDHDVFWPLDGFEHEDFERQAKFGSEFEQSVVFFEEGNTLPRVPTISAGLASSEENGADQYRTSVVSEGPNGIIQDETKPSPSSSRRVTKSPVTRKRKRSHTRFPADAISVLQEWLDAHHGDPYPSADDKRHLSSQAGLSIKQVSTWFTNSRRRQLSPVIQDELEDDDDLVSDYGSDDLNTSQDIADSIFKVPTKVSVVDQKADAIDLAAAASTDVPWENTWPDTLDRYRCLDFPPCKRGFSTKQELTKHIQDHLLGEEDVTAPMSESQKAYGSLRSVQSLRSVSSVGSAFSQCSDALVSLPPKRGRRRKPTGHDVTTLSQTPASMPATGEPVYYCTFCGKELNIKTWKRHEETQHLPRKQWTCLAHGFEEGGRCVFCNISNPTETHATECHRIAACLQAPDRDRTFQRKDHLAQHLKNFHGITPLSDELATKWHSSIDHSRHRWHCGFCSASLPTWNERARHIAKHFRRGATMIDWDASKEDLVEIRDPQSTFVSNAGTEPSTSVDLETNGSLAATLQRTTLAAPSSRPGTIVEHLSGRKLRIGSWTRTAHATTDLIVFYDPYNATLYYYTMENSVGYRMEIAFSSIQYLCLYTPSEPVPFRSGIKKGFEGMVVTLRSFPKFFRALPELGTFEPCEDFTDNRQASHHARHYLHGNSNVLAEQFAKLMSLESFRARHRALSRLLAPTAEADNIDKSDDG